METRAATPSNVELLNDRNREWDAAGARDRVAKWASSDGSGDKDKVDWSQYARAFMWSDPSGDGDFGDYKLGFCDVVDGDLRAIWKGVVAVASVLQGSRGGVHIPEADEAHVRAICEHYYKQAAKTFKDDSIKAPWERTLPQEVVDFQRAFGTFDGVERRYATIGRLEARDNGDPDSLFSATGTAIVFDSFSLDLGGFKEVISPDAVREALEAEDADFHLLWDHDTSLVLARNKNGTLQTKITEEGVDFWGRIARTSYAADLRVLLERGDVDECSFAFTVDEDGDEWRVDPDGTVVRTVTKMKRIYDLTICARGAYPATSSTAVRNYVHALAEERAAAAGHNLSVDTEERALTPGLVAWDEEQGYCDVACDIECALEAMIEDRAVYAWVLDINVRNGSEAIACLYDCGTYESEYLLIGGITYDADDEPVLPDASTFQKIEKNWVAVATGTDEDDLDAAGLRGLGRAQKREAARVEQRQLAAREAMSPAEHRDDEPDPVVEADRVEVDEEGNGVLTEDGIQTDGEATMDTEADVEGHAPDTNELADEIGETTSREDAERAAHLHKVHVRRARARAALALGGEA